MSGRASTIRSSPAMSCATCVGWRIRARPDALAARSAVPCGPRGGAAVRPREAAPREDRVSPAPAGPGVARGGLLGGPCNARAGPRLHDRPPGRQALLGAHGPARAADDGGRAVARARGTVDPDL